MKKILILSFCLMLMAFALTACGNNTGNTDTDNTQTTNDQNGTDQNGTDQNGTNQNGTSGSNLGNDIGNAVNDVGNAVDDVVDGVTDGLTGSYDTYDNAYNYFMGQFSNTDGRYEVRNNDKDLTEYTSGSQGYHFELHDTTKSDNESKVGDFYVDSKTGKVYKSGENNEVSEYDFSDLK